jgi:hypothetical protein
MEDGRHGDGTAIISPNDVLALRAMLQFYEYYLLMNKMPSAKRSQSIMLGYVLMVKLSYSDAMVLTVEEVTHMKDALGVFMAQVKRQISRTEGRDGVLVSCEQLLAYLEKAFGSQPDKA